MCVRVVLVILFMVVTWRFGDWRNWRRYHPTILFFVMSALLYNVLLYNHPMWEYNGDGIIPNHTLSALSLSFIVFPCTVLLYIPHFPKSMWLRTAYVLMWGAIYSLIEWFMLKSGLIEYHNGWTYIASALFDFGIFVMLLVHHKKPLWAYGISLVAVVLLMWLYQVPTQSMK